MTGDAHIDVRFGSVSSAQRGGRTYDKRECSQCCETKSESVYARTPGGKDVVCLKCRRGGIGNSLMWPSGLAPGELTFVQYVELRGLSRHYVRLIQRAAKAYRTYATWNAQTKKASERYAGETVESLLSYIERRDQALASQLYTATVLLANEQEKAA